MTLPQRIIDEARSRAEQIVDGMCLTWDHSFGLMDAEEHDALRRSFSQIAYHNVRPAIEQALLAAEQRGRDEERERLPDAIDLYRLVKRLGLRKHSEIAKAIAAAIRTEKDKG